jgi:hypothetical protein
MNAAERVARRKRTTERLLRRLGLSRADAKRAIAQLIRLATTLSAVAGSVGLR